MTSDAAAAATGVAAPVLDLDEKHVATVSPELAHQELGRI